MLFHVFQHKLVGIDDPKSVAEHFNAGSDVEILWSIEYGLVGRRAWLGNTGALQELSSDCSRVSDRRFVDSDHVVR